MIHAVSYGETTNLMKCIEQTQKAKAKLERIQSLYPDELYISVLMMCTNLVNPNWKDQLESEIRRQEQNGETYTLSSCVQFLTNKCSTQSAMKSLNEKVGIISKSGKSSKKGGDQKSISKPSANDGEKEKEKQTAEVIKKKKEVDSYIKTN